MDLSRVDRSPKLIRVRVLFNLLISSLTTNKSPIRRAKKLTQILVSNDYLINVITAVFLTYVKNLDENCSLLCIFFHTRKNLQKKKKILQGFWQGTSSQISPISSVFIRMQDTCQEKISNGPKQATQKTKLFLSHWNLSAANFCLANPPDNQQLLVADPRPEIRQDRCRLLPKITSQFLGQSPLPKRPQISQEFLFPFRKF